MHIEISSVAIKITESPEIVIRILKESMRLENKMNFNKKKKRGVKKIRKAMKEMTKLTTSLFLLVSCTFKYISLMYIQTFLSTFALSLDLHLIQMWHLFYMLPPDLTVTQISDEAKSLSASSPLLVSLISLQHLENGFLLGNSFKLELSETSESSES